MSSSGLKKIIKKLVIITSLVLGIILLGLVYKAYVINQPCKHDIGKINKSNRIKVSNDQVKRLQESLKIQTISYSQTNQNIQAIEQFGKFIKEEFKELESYPFVKFSFINNYSILYEIKGSRSDLKPYLLAAHFDVVPANAQEDKWTHEPFEANIEDGYIYARGAIDDKSSMLGQLEAVRIFLKNNGQPQRSFYLAYGHDEEVKGKEGAGKMSELLSSVSLEYVLDEGSMIVEDIFPEIKRTISSISIAEKGYLTVKFFTNVTGGHSSMPNDKESAIYILADGISKLKANKIPSMLGLGPEKDLLEGLAVHFGFFQRLVLSNIWFFKPIIEMIFSKLPVTDSLIRTTTAVTMFNAGIKENVLPAYAEFVVNHRLHSSQSCEEILNYDLSVMQDSRIKYEILDCTEPSHISPTDSLGYHVIKHTVMQLFPDSIPLPGLMNGATDSRFYVKSTKNIYKFQPVVIKSADLKRFHGVDERVSLDNFEDLINFYFKLMENSDKMHIEMKEYIHPEL
jgi:carboxypeptidase PM20D1